MDLHNWFYLVGIVFMGLLISLMAILVVLVFYIKKRITEFVDRVKDVVTHPTEIAAKMIKKSLRS